MTRFISSTNAFTRPPKQTSGMRLAKHGEVRPMEESWFVRALRCLRSAVLPSFGSSPYGSRRLRAAATNARRSKMNASEYRSVGRKPDGGTMVRVRVLATIAKLFRIQFHIGGWPYGAAHGYAINRLESEQRG